MTLKVGQNLSPQDVEANFAEIDPPLGVTAALVESSRCLNCYDAPCTIACPTHIDVPSFIKKISSGNVKGAARVILDANPMGHSCARACPVDVLCEGACVMNHQEHPPIPIAKLQRYATDAALQKGWRLFSPGADTGKHVAIVGGGPAGLSAAQDLRRLGHAVTIFDAKEQLGGLNTYGIAQYKLRPDTAIAEAKMITDLGVTVKTKTKVGVDVSFADLLATHDAVFVGVGLGATQSLGIPGEDAPGVVDALTFIEHLKAKPYGAFKVPPRVLVVGMGNTAVDAGTQARRLGAEDVCFVYRRGESEMSAYEYEYDIAKKDGCTFRWYTAPTKVVVEGGKVVGLECTSMRDGKPVPGTTHVVPCDMIIKAIGQQKQKSLLSGVVVLDDAGRVRVDPTTLQTSNPKIFAGGDAVNGGKEIVNAAADGKRAARAIDAYLTTTAATTSSTTSKKAHAPA
jgi:dihydropyrimidine dehydrogenase (NAD+) subunit PreT